MSDTVDSEHWVMVVEDDPDAREILSEMLTDEGFVTAAASNGREALERLEAAKRARLPCVILLDVMMPVMDGREFRARQQTDPTLAEIPVVVLTAHADAAATAQSMNAAAFLKKPVDFEVLLSVVRQHCA